MERRVVVYILLTLSIFALTAGGCTASAQQRFAVTPLLPPAAPVLPAEIPPAAASVPTPTMVPFDSSTLQITYVCNDGFIIATAGKKILIDALFHDRQGICQADSDETAQSAQAPFDDADLVLISHSHWDHFNPQIVGSYLQNNPHAILIGEKSAVDSLQKNFASFDLVQKQVQSVELARKQKTRMSFSGIDVEIISAPADVPNLGFLFKVGQFTFFHSGDTGLDAEMAADFQTYGLCKKNINFSFLPYWFFTDPQGQSLLEMEICAANYIPMHYAGEDVQEIFVDVTSSYPNAILFPEEWQIWSP